MLKNLPHIKFREPIKKNLHFQDEIRICKILYDTEVGMKYGGQPRWHHLPCFVKCRNELLYFAGGENLPGFDDLKKADQIIVKTEIKYVN